MGITTLVNEIREFIIKSQEERGPYWLVMLVSYPYAAPGTKWNLVLSAPWIDALGERTALFELVTGLKAALPIETQSMIERLSLVRTADVLVEAIRDNFPMEGFGRQRITNFAVNGYDIPEAILILADKPMEAHPEKR